MPKTIKRAVVGAMLLALAGSLAIALVACGKTSSTSHQPQSGASSSPGWHSLPTAPITVDAALTSVWTGRELIVSGVQSGEDGTFLLAREVAAAYDPAARTWRRLAAPPPMEGPCKRGAVWTRAKMLVWGCLGKAAAFDPLTNRWQALPKPLTGAGITVWSGHELIGWGGGCCGDAWSDGSAYDPASGTWRTLAPSPLAPSQQPVGAWTGRELVLLVDGIDPVDGKPYPASFARAAAYDPSTDAWRRIAAPPVAPRGKAVWTGRELLVAGNGRTTLAYDPAANRWRRLAPLPSTGIGETMVWAGTRLLLWSAPDASSPGSVAGFAYEPADGRWSSMPAMPSLDTPTTAAWTGQRLLVWSGSGAGAALTSKGKRDD